MVILITVICLVVGEVRHKNGTNSDSTRRLLIEVISDRNFSSVRIQGRYIHYRQCHVPPSEAGLYLMVLHQETGVVLARRFAAGLYQSGLKDMQLFLERVQPGRIIVMVVMHEIFAAIDSDAKEYFSRIGQQFAKIKPKSTYALVATKNGQTWAEGVGVATSTLRITAQVKLTKERVCAWLPETTPDALRLNRTRFCSKYVAYGSLCNCSRQDPLSYRFQPLTSGVNFTVPIAILSGKRTTYLYRALQSLLPNRGLNRNLITIYTQQYSRELNDLANLLNLRVHITNEESELPAGRISMNLKNAIVHSMRLFPNADKLVVLEDDLEVSPDFISYMSQTESLLDEDVTLYCVSAWNDLSYRHSSNDPTLLYRTSYFPGLGWMMKRSILMNEMIPRWKETWEDWDWDMWFRSDEVILGRESIVPDIPRTYHFGWLGGHVYSGAQFEYYSDKAFNTQADVQLQNVTSLLFSNYRETVINIPSNARLPDMNIYFRTCLDIFPETNNITERERPYILTFSMKHAFDISGIHNLLTCLGVWDMDVRGEHRGIWRLFINKNPVVLIGIPYSYYSHTFLQELGSSPLFDFGPYRIKRGRRPSLDGKSPPKVVKFSTPEDDVYTDDNEDGWNI